MPTQILSLSFFERLSYDIRAVIYSYLEPDQFPPFSPRFQELGFLLSCRQAKTELEEVAFLRLEAFLERFRRAAPFPMVVKSDIENLRCVTVELPFGAFSGAGWDGAGMRVMWKREVLTALHQLFAQHFDMVRLHVCDRQNTGASLEKHTLLALGRVELAMHGLLRDIEYMIKRVNAHRDTADACIIMDTIFPYVLGERSRHYPAEHVKASRISLTWDLRSNITTSEAPVALNGKLHQARPKIIDAPSSSSRVATKDLRPAIEEEPLEPIPNGGPWYCERPTYYHLHGHRRLVGEMCLQSRHRWAKPRSWSSNELLNGLDEFAEYISSSHLGAQPRVGLQDMTESQYCNEEANISQALWGIQQVYNANRLSRDIQELSLDEA